MFQRLVKMVIVLATGTMLGGTASSQLGSASLSPSGRMAAGTKPTLTPRTAAQAIPMPAAPKQATTLATAPNSNTTQAYMSTATAVGPTAKSQGPSSPCASRLTVYGFPGGNPATMLPALDGSGVSRCVVVGASWVFGWKLIEPVQGQYHWGAIDQALAAAAKDGRPSIVRVIAGEKSPSWVQPTITIPAGCGCWGGSLPSADVTMPIPWSTGFLSAWTQFIAAYGARYNGNTNISIVEMSGAGILGEMYLPHPWSGWATAGYSDAALTSAWEQIITAYRNAFPSHDSALDIDEPFGMGTGGSNVLPAVLTFASQYYPHVLLQQNGLKVGVGTGSGSYGADLAAASLHTRVGWQLYGGVLSASDLTAVISIALSVHATYLEDYLSDIANPVYATVYATL